MSLIGEFKNLINFRNWSLLETMFAFYPMVSGWVLTSIPVYLWWLLIMDCIAYSKFGFNLKRMPKLYRTLFVFIMVHEFLWIFIVKDLNSVYFNFWIGIVITMGSIFFVAPILNFEKLKSPLNFVAIISVLGLAYQLLLFTKGTPTGQITIPPFASSRDTEDLVLLLRPSSFFSEPASYCNFMIVPLFVCLLDMRFIAAFIIVISMLLSTSTTGVVISGLMLCTYFFTQKVSLKWKFLVVVGILTIGFALTQSELFETTMNKVEKTDLSENERVSIGLTVLPQLSADEVIFGIPYTNISNMYNAGKLKIDTFTWIENGKSVVFVSSIWNILFLYGFFGFILYLFFYLSYARKSRLLLPFFFAVFAKMFSDPTAVGGAFFFEICFMTAFVKWEKMNNKRRLVKA